MKGWWVSCFVAETASQREPAGLACCRCLIASSRVSPSYEEIRNSQERQSISRNQR